MENITISQDFWAKSDEEISDLARCGIQERFIIPESNDAISELIPYSYKDISRLWLDETHGISPTETWLSPISLHGNILKFEALHDDPVLTHQHMVVLFTSDVPAHDLVLSYCAEGGNTVLSAFTIASLIEEVRCGFGDEESGADFVDCMAEIFLTLECQGSGYGTTAIEAHEYLLPNSIRPRPSHRPGAMKLPSRKRRKRDAKKAA